MRVDGHGSFHEVSAGLLLRPIAGSVARKPERGQVSEKADALVLSTNVKCQRTSRRQSARTVFRPRTTHIRISFVLELKAEDIAARDEPVRLSGIPD